MLVCPNCLRSRGGCRRRRLLLLLLCFAVALLCGACAAASRPPAADAPRPALANYPLLITGSSERQEQTLAAWRKLTHEQSVNSTAAAAPQLDPATATVRSLPVAAASPLLQLPPVSASGAGITAEEATREALRRFIAQSSPLLGAPPEAWSLLEVRRQPDVAAVERARYAQRSLPYPLRGGYGSLEISFDSNHRIVGLSSTAIPDVEQLRARLSGLRPLLSVDEAQAKLTNQLLVFTDAAGNRQSLVVAAEDSVTDPRLVLYPVRSASDDTLAVHLAWEIEANLSAPLVVYLDAVTGAVLGAIRQDQIDRTN